MTQAQKAAELAATLRICAGRGGCTRCPLDSFVGCCTEELKRESAEMIEDQQATIQTLVAQVEGMIDAILRLTDKYSGEGAYGKEEEID